MQKCNRVERINGYSVDYAFFSLSIMQKYLNLVIVTIFKCKKGMKDKPLRIINSLGSVF